MKPAEPIGYADDTGATAKETEELGKVAKATNAFAKATGQQLNADKSKSWCVGPRGVEALTELTSQEGGFARVTKLRCLGVRLRTAPRQPNDMLAQRFENGLIRARRIAWTPLPFKIKAELIATLVVPA